MNTIIIVSIICFSIIVIVSIICYTNYKKESNDNLKSIVELLSVISGKTNVNSDRICIIDKKLDKIANIIK